MAHGDVVGKRHVNKYSVPHESPTSIGQEPLSRIGRGDTRTDLNRIATGPDCGITIDPATLPDNPHVVRPFPQIGEAGTCGDRCGLLHDRAPGSIQSPPLSPSAHFAVVVTH